MPKPRRDSSKISRPTILTFLILAIVAALSLASEVLKPLALSVLLAFALTPLAGALQKHLRFPRVAAVVFTVVLSLTLMAGVGWVVGRQLTSLAGKIESYQKNIERKIEALRPTEDSAIEKVTKVAKDITAHLEAAPLSDKISDVRVVAQPTFRERLQTAVGPYLEFLGVGSFVLVLVLFMMMSPEDLRDRVVGLFGGDRISLTTRAMDEIGTRISRYLATFTLVNSGYGIVIGVGLWAIGVPYALLWGSIAGITRFIPYVGPAAAFVLPVVFSIAHFPGWIEAIEVIALFAVMETLLNSFLEPVIYGKTTGVSALGLLVAAMFWTWLWGLMGLLLSTPLTVCLAVLGKYVPGLGIFATLLGEEAELEPEVKFYQRLVALDRDGAVELVEGELRSHPRADVFDSILIPSLSRAERDDSQGELSEQDFAFVHMVVGGVIDDLEGTTELSLATVANAANSSETPPSAPLPSEPSKGTETTAKTLRVVGIATENNADRLALRMLANLLEPSKIEVEMIDETLSPMALADRLSHDLPALVVFSQVPPEGLTSARYQIRRLRARFATLPIIVGRWGAKPPAAGTNNNLENLLGAGPSTLATSLAEARDAIVKSLQSNNEAPSTGNNKPTTVANSSSKAQKVESGYQSAGV